MSDQIVSNLNTIIGILGTTKPSFWPGFEKEGILVSGLSIGDFIPSETGGAPEALEDDFAPYKHPGRLYSYHFHPTGDHHMNGIDDADYSFATDPVDDAFSVGAWILPNALVSNVILGKHDSAGAAEEWRFFIDAAGLLSLELHDASASATEIGVTANVLPLRQWRFVVATYDGAQADPRVLLYVNAIRDGTGLTAETGAYVSMEAGAAPLTLGCSGVTAVPVNEFHGRIGLPFLTGKELTQAEVNALYNVGKELMGF